MPSRQDQLHSYQYSQQRVVAALVSHDPDPHRSPLRRAGATVLVSVVVAALAVGGAAVYGLITGNSSVEPRDDKVVFMEKGTGARYVYLKSDDKMHPVLNYTSALLITNSTEPSIKNASQKSLAEVPLGDPLGIPNAPDTLPAAKDGLLPAIWTVCSQIPDGSGPKSVVSLGESISDGTLLPVPRADTPAAELRGLLVSDSSDRTFLVYGNKRFLIPANRLEQTRVRFGWNQEPLKVAPAWVNAIPLGPDLAAPSIDGFGDDSEVAPGYQVGQVLLVKGDNGSPDQWGVVLKDGIADLTDVQARLLRAEPDFLGQKELDITLYGSLANKARSKTQLVTQANADGVPPSVPVLLNGPESVCATYNGGNNGAVSIRIGPTVPVGTAVVGSTTTQGDVQADQVKVPRGKGALVVSAASPTAPATIGTVSVITDTGRSYPLASRDLLSRLGYAGVTPAAIPTQLVGLLPVGPALDPERARQAITTVEDKPTN
ncbi:type VII secretion protein EccB [Winogradskya humida]|uniref:type VII secretion protein EccB n=1 Tax=Winogradskya humida TaxID=113566 RepID=UPI001943BE63|nr:type VII secretion protein EccB [Actinoplanes humidus]